MEKWFGQAREYVEDLELRYLTLLAASRSKDEQLRKLSGDTPLVWITGPERAKAKLALHPDASHEDGIHPIHMDTKYYTADVLISVAESNIDDDRNHAVILALSEMFEQKIAEEVFDAFGEVRICICNDSSAADWCLEQGVEWVNWSEVDERLRASLEATIWPNLQKKEKQPQHQTSHATMAVTREQSIEQKEVKRGEAFAESRKRKDMDEEEQIELLEKFMLQARNIKDGAASLNDVERRRRAANAAEEMIMLLGLENELDDDERDQ